MLLIISSSKVFFQVGSWFLIESPFKKRSRCTTPQGGTRVQHCGALRHAGNRPWIYECLDTSTLDLGAPSPMKWLGWDDLDMLQDIWVLVVTLIDYSQRQGYIYIYMNICIHIYIYIQMTCSHQIPLWSIVPWCPILVGPLHYFWCLNLPNLLFFPNSFSIPISRSWTSAKTNKSICGSGICWSNITCTYVLSHTTQSLAISWLVGGLKHEFCLSTYWE